MKKNSNLITTLLTILIQIKIFHWQTKLYSQHTSFDKYYNKMNILVDKFIESYQGKYNRINLKNNNIISIKDISDTNINDLIKNINIFLTKDINNYIDISSDYDLLSLRDEMISETNILKYLLTLE